RFDWSGIIRSLTYDGHSYFGQWYDKHDPLVHDSITGPVDLFDNNRTSGYDEAAPGAAFLRIGVGLVEKPDTSPYADTHTYKIIDPGKRRLARGTNWIQFTHEISGKADFGYLYSKKILLVDGKPEMVLSHELRNTGSKLIDTTVYNHGFFQIDGEPAGPGLVWSFSFEPRTTGDFGGMAEIRGRQIVYLRELKPGERVLAPLEGYAASADDHRFTLENRKTGAGIRVAGDRPITKLTFWSRRMAYSPEASIHLRIAPGKTEKWETRFEFYSVHTRQRN
ncbi:MAG: hypothetical protein M3Z36_02660, partial [Acidobacteriota bacterium]|nr:hypothetical protein [Acidobacteriota bacterium]